MIICALSSRHRPLPRRRAVSLPHRRAVSLPRRRAVSLPHRRHRLPTAKKQSACAPCFSFCLSVSARRGFAGLIPAQRLHLLPRRCCRAMFVRLVAAAGPCLSVSPLPQGHCLSVSPLPQEYCLSALPPLQNHRFSYFSASASALMSLIS
jgi:hypothetical protein